MSYVIRYSRHIDGKRFAKLPQREKKRLHDAIEKKLMVNPLAFGKPLRASLFGARSLRVGDYRIIYRLEGKHVDILLFGHRSSIYAEAENIV